MLSIDAAACPAEVFAADASCQHHNHMQFWLGKEPVSLSSPTCHDATLASVHIQPCNVMPNLRCG